MPETSTIQSAGLFARDLSRTRIPLSGVSIDAEISGFCARVVVAHRYVNRETTPIEAVFVFPLDEGAAVCGFEAVVDGTLVVGEVQEREKAFETYDDAMEHGHGAFLLDEERPDVFQASVGNLPPGKDVLVRLTYVAELSIGSRLLVYGLVEATRPTSVRLSATRPSGPLSVEVSLDGARVTAGRTVATLAARARIRELEESPDWLGTRGSQQKERRQNDVTKAIVRLSLRYGLISRETSFVAVERRDTPVLGDLQLRRVPIALTSGWGGMDERMSSARPVGSMWLGMVPSLDAVPGSAGSPTPVMPEAVFHAATSPATRRGQRRPPARPSGLNALVALQAADGSWDLSAELAAIVGRSLSDIEAPLTGASGASPAARRAWATALALAWLQLHADAREDE